MTKKIDCAPVKVYTKSLQSDQQSFLLIEVNAVPSLIKSTVDKEKLNQFCASFEHLSHISFPEIGYNSVSITNGMDNLDLIHYRQIAKGPKNAPWGVETQLGWTCAGKTDLALDKTYPVQFTQFNSHPNMDEEMFKMVSDWMKIENLGIASPKEAMSKNDKRAFEILDNTKQLIDGQIGLLWKENAKLPNNRWLAEKQLYQLNDKLSKNAQLKQMYKETLEKDLLNRYVTKFDPDTEDSIRLLLSYFTIQ